MKKFALKVAITGTVLLSMLGVGAISAAPAQAAVCSSSTTMWNYGTYWLARTNVSCTQQVDQIVVEQMGRNGWYDGRKCEDTHGCTYYGKYGNPVGTQTFKVCGAGYVKDHWYSWPYWTNFSCSTRYG